MKFSKDSEITIVLTSCGRFDLLRKTLESLDRYNTAPIFEVLITEDSGDDTVESCIPEHWRERTTFFINKPRLGQLCSIDLAYSRVKTRWIFHCEDDWYFYRPGFIEDSMVLLEANHKAIQVWSRSYNHDLSVHSPYVRLGERQIIDNIPFYQLSSDKEDWQGFSFNPGLRRLADYQKFRPYAQFDGEKKISRIYADSGNFALILENDAVLHTGFGEHLVIPEEKVIKLRRKKLERIRIMLSFISGLLLGALLC